MSFGFSGGPGRASGGSMCPKGGPDPVFVCFGDLNCCPEAGIWGLGKQFGLHFGKLLGVCRLLGTFLEAPCAPGAAWIRFGRNFARQVKEKNKHMSIVQSNHMLKSMC